MTATEPYRPDPDRDLLLERFVAVPRELVWAAWTMPHHLKKWVTPAPFTTTECEVDLRPGGIFRTVMRSPEGQEHATTGCYLEIVERTRLVWTTALGPNFRPVDEPAGLSFTAVISLASVEDGTRYSALAMHGDTSVRRRHADMGFHQGWATALDQLVSLIADGTIQR